MNKCLEYYLDSKKYNQEQVKENIEEMKKEFPKKEFTVNVEKNEFGMYIITFNFKSKNTIFDKIKIFIKRKRKNILLLQEKSYKPSRTKKKTSRLEKYYDCQYGKYKQTYKYKPY